MVDLKRALVDVSAGALVGAVATVPMTALMLTAQRLGLMGTQPPRRLTDAAIDVVHESMDDAPVDPPEPARRALTAITHLGFGAAAGVPFALGHRVLPARVPVEAAGAVYALGIWTSAYLGWVPALGVMPRADRDRPDRPASMIAAHLVYGSVLGAGLRLLRPRG